MQRHHVYYCPSCEQTVTPNEHNRCPFCKTVVCRMSRELANKVILDENLVRLDRYRALGRLIPEPEAA